MAVKVSSGAMGATSGFPKMKYIKVFIYTNGIIINPINQTNNKLRHISTIKFPKEIQVDVKKLLIDKMGENPGIFDIEVFDNIPIKLDIAI